MGMKPKYIYMKKMYYLQNEKDFYPPHKISCELCKLFSKNLSTFLYFFVGYLHLMGSG